MTAISALQNVHVEGSFGNFENKSENQLLKIKKKHKNLAKYQIGVPIILILLCFLALILDLFSQKNIIIMFSVIFFIIGVFSVLMANKNVNYDNED